MVRSWLEVSPGRIIHNLEVIRSLMPRKVPVIAVVKANAYGHGAIQVARALFQAGIHTFAVACLDEALEIREALPASAEILVFGGLEAGREALFRKARLTAGLFEDIPVPEGIRVQVKIDTGMGRLGFNWETFRDRFNPRDRIVTGYYSHFSSADASEAYSMEQLHRFNIATTGLPGIRHISNSAGLRFADAHLDMVRPGLALYGISPCPGFPELKPALRWRAAIISLRDLPRGEPVGYNRTFVTPRRSRIGILPVGYADGYNRLLSGSGQVRLDNGALVPVIGIVSMDLIAIDLTDYPEIGRGHAVTLLEADPGSPLSARAIADKSGTIPYEILTSIGSRVARTYADF